MDQKNQTMTKVFAYQQGKKKDIGWHAETAYLTKPKIRKGFKIIDGIKFYSGYQYKGQIFRADLFHATFG